MENLKFRRSLLQSAAKSKAVKEEIWIACARDFEFFCDSLLWTANQKDFPDSPKRPLITWDYQVEGMDLLDRAVGKWDILGEKSRDMGFTWLVLARLFHRWMFKRGQSFLIASRKESYVDETGNSDSLFWKLDYLLANLPVWMQPALTRNMMHFGNDENGSAIDGETTNKDLGRGGRRTAVMLDEFAAVEPAFAYKILNSTRDITNTRIFISTPQGAAGAFYDQRTKMKAETPERIIRWHWTQHPVKSQGLYYIDGKPRSPWYDEQCRRAAHSVEIAQELDIGYEESGYQFFEQVVLDRLVRQYASDPTAEGDIEYGQELTGTYRKLPRGNLKLWLNLEDGKPPAGTYGIGCDISTGKAGEYSSQSVASILDLKSGRKVGQYATNKIDEREFGRLAVVLCRFFHDAKLIWEANGPGQAFGKAITETTSYRNLWLRRDEQKLTRDVKMVAGWWSDKDTKYELMAKYREALAQGKFINPCREALLECGQYIMQANRDVVHARAAATQDPTASGQLHGDMVVADAVANLLLTCNPVEKPDTVPIETPLFCFKSRFDRVRKQERESHFTFPRR